MLLLASLKTNLAHLGVGVDVYACVVSGSVPPEGWFTKMLQGGLLSFSGKSSGSNELWTSDRQHGCTRSVSLGQQAGLCQVAQG